MRPRLDLSGFWHGRLTLNPHLDAARPPVIEREFYLPLPWNKQIEDLRWPSATQELSGVVRSLQNQNFRDVQRKFNEGTITYRRLLDLPDEPSYRRSRRAFLVFEGSNYFTTARVNGVEVGTHAGGHLGFEFEVTEALQVGGPNRFEITVDNLRRRDAAPQEQFNWQNYGGVYRPLYLEWRPAIYIAHAAATPGRDAKGWFVGLAVEMSGPPTAGLTLQVVSGAERQVVSLAKAADTRYHARLRFASPRVWTPATRGDAGGTMSYAHVTSQDAADADRVSIPFGFRTVEVRGGDILVNGESVRLRGAAWHEQHPTFGSSVPGWQVVHDLKLMKQAGLNAVRAAHYPHGQAFYDACDREGMLALAELPCWQFNEHHFESPTVRDFCVAYARAMVRQLAQHPSIIGWVIQNESKTFHPAAAGFFRAIHDAFKEADPSRFTISAESPEPPEHLAVVKKTQGEPEGPLPPTTAFIDAVGVNNYAGWYAEKAEYLAKVLDHAHTQLDDTKPLVVTEFGAEGILGQRSLEMHPWTEDYQAELLCRHLRAILDRPYVAGFFLWLFIDYEAASISIRAINAKGLVDEYRRPKLAFNEVKRLLEAYETPR